MRLGLHALGIGSGATRGVIDAVKASVDCWCIAPVATPRAAPAELIELKPAIW